MVGAQQQQRWQQWRQQEASLYWLCNPSHRAMRVKPALALFQPPLKRFRHSLMFPRMVFCFFFFWMKPRVLKQSWGIVLLSKGSATLWPACTAEIKTLAAPANTLYWSMCECNGEKKKKKKAQGWHPVCSSFLSATRVSSHTLINTTISCEAVSRLQSV